MFLQSNVSLILISILSLMGLTLHGSYNYFPTISKYIESPIIYGVIIMFHSVFGTSGITKTPKRLENLLDQKWFKFFTLMLVSYAAVRDLEDMVFVSLLFLGITQLLRTKEERREHPYIF